MAPHSTYTKSVVTGTVLVKVIDANTQQPLADISIRANGIKLVSHTDLFGYALIELPLGNHVLSFMGFDHLSTQANVIITEDENHLDVEMS